MRISGTNFNVLVYTCADAALRRSMSAAAGQLSGACSIRRIPNIELLNGVGSESRSILVLIMTMRFDWKSNYSINSNRNTTLVIPIRR